MPDPRKTTTTKRLPLTGAPAAGPLTPLRVGMPALDSIQKTIKFAPKAVQLITSCERPKQMCMKRHPLRSNWQNC